VLLPRWARCPGTTQARCLCYFKDGQDARGQHRQDACATSKTGKMPGDNTGKMPVLLQRRARCPGTTQARCPGTTQAGCLCYFKDGQDARGQHRQDACATSKMGKMPGDTGKMPVLLPRNAKAVNTNKTSDLLHFLFADSPVRRFSDSFPLPTGN
jgi:hypothetical protein